jgi:hypothetical protein
VVNVPPVVEAFATELATLGWVSDVLVAGSLALGDYTAGVSDLDLVALVNGPVDAGRLAELKDVHGRVDEGIGAGMSLGCAYVDTATIPDLGRRHPTWTHGRLVHRVLSRVTRAELVRHGFAVAGRPPREMLPPMSDDDIRDAARAELTGYWTWAARRPWLWLDPVVADLGLTSMARGRHGMDAGELLTKTRAVDRADAPAWLVAQLRARRRGEPVRSPRLRTALIAWRDARRTTARARRA